MKNKECIIIHGCPPNQEKAKNLETRDYDKHWMPWVKDELEKVGITTFMPLMPDPWEPKFEKFKQEFEKYSVTENTILIGHSCGCAFLVNWLSQNEQKIDKLILVAPWKVGKPENGASREDFYNFIINPSINDRVNKIIIFTSNNEVEDGKKSVELYKDVLKCEVIEIPNMGHFILKHMGTDEFPALLEKVIS